jgi:hypothetical protein
MDILPTVRKRLERMRNVKLSAMRLPRTFFRIKCDSEKLHLDLDQMTGCQCSASCCLDPLFRQLCD